MRGLVMQWLGCWTRDSKSRGFESWPFHFQVTTSGKLFTCICQMLQGWESNSRSIAMCHRLQWYNHLRAPSPYLLKHDCIIIQSSHFTIICHQFRSGQLQNHIWHRNLCKHAVNSIQLETHAFDKLMLQWSNHLWAQGLQKRDEHPKTPPTLLMGYATQYNTFTFK